MSLLRATRPSPSVPILTKTRTAKAAKEVEKEKKEAHIYDGMQRLADIERAVHIQAQYEGNDKKNQFPPKSTAVEQRPPTSDTPPSGLNPTTAFESANDNDTLLNG